MQFRLGFLLLFVAAVAAAGAVVSFEAREWKRIDTTLEMLRGLGARYGPVKRPLHLPMGVNLTGTDVEDKDLKKLRGAAKWIDMIDLSYTRVSDDGIEELCEIEFPRLRFILLSETAVTDQGIARLRERFGDRLEILTPDEPHPMADDIEYLSPNP